MNAENHASKEEKMGEQDTQDAVKMKTVPSDVMGNGVDNVCDNDEADVHDDKTEQATETVDTYQVESTLFLAKMTSGFVAMKERRKLASSMPPLVPHSEHETVPPPINSRVTVNFIDPTTIGIGTGTINDPSAHQKFKFMSPLGGKVSSNDGFMALDLFEKVKTIFARKFDSTLQSIPYENIRGGATGTILKLPVQLALTRSHSAGEAATTGDVPWGGASGTNASLTDPAEWHNNPHCHVFIAACEGMEHYRSKVRPALQAFVSQVECASSMGATPGVRGSGHGGKVPTPVGSCSSHYIILYVPIRSKDSNNTSRGLSPTNTEGLVQGNRLGTGLASRISAARRQIQSNTSREMSDSVHSGGTTSTDFEIDSTDTGSMPLSAGSFAHISKAEKEIFRKFVADFPNGSPCIMSTLTGSTEGSSLIHMHPLKNQEWAHFLQTMGTAIVNGFQDRCRRYDEELRRLDAARTGIEKGSSKGKSGVISAFDLSHFFLVKESLAFTYEQMQLHLDALLQYEELRLFLPESADEVMSDGIEKRKSKTSSPSKLLDDVDDNTMKLAITGDTVGFRRHLRSTTGLLSIKESVVQYLFAREVDLLFQLGSPVNVIVRTLDFVKSMYRMKINSINTLKKKGKSLSQEEVVFRYREAEVWALDFCWDVKNASEAFFQVLVYDDEESIADFSFSKIEEGPSLEDIDTSYLSASRSEIMADPDQESLERSLAGKLCDLLEFARLRYLKLGDTELPVVNPIRKLWNETPNDMKSEWGPWKAGNPKLTNHRNNNGSLRDLKSAIAMDEEHTDLVVPKGSARLLEGALSSKEIYEERYLELSTAIINACRHSGRKRMASRLQAERAELHIRNKEYSLAVRALLPVINICAIDRWDRGHFWHLFRLASCQRMTGKVASYLNTLTQCFGPHLSHTTPPKAANVLQQDFEVVVEQERVSGFRLGIASFLETEMDVADTASGKTSMLLTFVRKKLVNTFCNVGDDIKVMLTVKSYLPKPIELRKLSILVVSLETYESVFHNRGAVSDEDAFQVLSLDIPVTLESGSNDFEFQWKPMTTGQYILSTVQMQWKCACFHYDSAVMRKALSGIDVLPCAPTQSIELNPLFLIPGQIQQVRITFNPGTDIIEKGTVELLCSDGLQVIPPGIDANTDDWRESCTVDLPPTKAGVPVVLTTMVKSSVIKTIEQKLGLYSGSDPSSAVAGFVQTMQAKVTTSYHHGLYSKVEGVIDTCMETALEAMVTTLDKPALTVDKSEAFSYDERILINVSLHCNTPVPFYLKEWDLKVPKLCLTKDGDLNHHIFGDAVVEGDQLSFGFNCVRTKNDADEGYSPSLLIVLQDEFGKTFNQVLPLDLESFYVKMRQDDEFSRTNSVTTELQLSVAQGLVGAPVTLFYRIDVSNLLKPQRKGSIEVNGSSEHELTLMYTLVSEYTDWIVGGKTQGILSCDDCKDFTLEFVGIPILPGVIKTFPNLRVTYESAGDHDAPSVTVHSRNPDLFNSLAFVNHVALACSAGLEV